MREKKLLSVALSDGMAMNECIASFHDADGELVQLHVDRRQVLDVCGNRGRLRVQVVFEYDQCEIIELPVVSVDGYRIYAVEKLFN